MLLSASNFLFIYELFQVNYLLFFLPRELNRVCVNWNVGVLKFVWVFLNKLLNSLLEQSNIFLIWKPSLKIWIETQKLAHQKSQLTHKQHQTLDCDSDANPPTGVLGCSMGNYPVIKLLEHCFIILRIGWFVCLEFLFYKIFN